MLTATERTNMLIFIYYHNRWINACMSEQAYILSSTNMSDEQVYEIYTRIHH